MTLPTLSSATKRYNTCSSIYQVSESLGVSLRPTQIGALRSSRGHEASDIGYVHMEDG